MTETITLTDTNFTDHVAISRLHAEKLAAKLQNPRDNHRTTVAIVGTLILGFTCLLLNTRYQRIQREKHPSPR